MYREAVIMLTFRAVKVIGVRKYTKRASKGRVARLMKANGIRSKVTEKYKATTNSNHNLPVADNVLNREFTADKPNQKWVSYITYINTKEGWLYLAGVMDLYGRSLVGWAMANHMRTELVSAALDQAIGRTEAKVGLLIHSDRGIQYASNDYQKLLKKNGFVCSMSRKGNCYGNALMESFWGKLKMEWLNDYDFKTRDEAKKVFLNILSFFVTEKGLIQQMGTSHYSCWEKSHRNFKNK
jgi:putative transposase